MAVFSAARYTQSLDYRHVLERQHTWLASHCDECIRKRYDSPSKNQKSVSGLSVIPGRRPKSPYQDAGLSTIRAASQLSILWSRASAKLLVR